jgi:hypothetical protein
VALDFLVAIVERLVEALGQQPADRSLAGAHQPDEEDISRDCGCRLR